MSEVKISAEPRTEFGKGGARRTRRAGMVPAVLYGHAEKPKHIALPAREFAAAIRKGGANQLFAIEVSDGTQVLALPKAIQRDPIKDTFEHVDLLLVRRGEKVTVEVPVQLTGEAAKDTLIVHDHDTLSVTADATKVPDHLEASIEGLEAGTQVTAADVELPSGVELAADPELPVAAVTAAPTAEQLEATLPEVEAPAEEAEAEAGEEAAEGAEAPAAEGEEAPAEAKTEA
ncbi:50S ribosomal protein L25/general stress protein Ctc [Micromonospora harpali]|uniref:Large ribosomal subunit protein bL25 n=2 Tax=Micromonospora TaxID=1873 RepID=A0A0D0X2C7_9ACTN|nr:MULTISPECIES: 50S ribosomal protein L25/general stress protein Ctc [Micromonospora]KIR65039.1 50S ribosomal protein L25 [Micromonospora haikouensis]MDI5937894.1 50S ribosomal protein L25/general stress protein Ctc [Micromonospora sp. DH15]OON32353.1 50S ribosomal protein L25/general stress protein Ctc [Micromonospora sp. Rc5]SCF03701.1 LSU ribosomal protein L25P [Micromonospora haikouensis]